MNYLKRIMLIHSYVIVTVLSCADDRAKHNNSEKSQYQINDIGDFSNHKKDFNITEVKYMGLGTSSRLDFYANSCGLKYQKDSLSKIENYVIYFDDKSNAQIEVLTVSRPEYAAVIAQELDPYVKRVRNFTDGGQNRGFCIGYYLSRIYNYAIKDNKLFLLGYDAPNASSQSIVPDDLKKLDFVCKALK
jgi:hypothetical protein